MAGRPAANPFDPADEVAYSRQPADLQGPARLVHDAATRLGLRPTHLPLAIDFEGEGSVGGGTDGKCVMCDTCDGYICAVGAKRDPAVAVLDGLVRRGLTLMSNTVAVRILWSGRRRQRGRLCGPKGPDTGGSSRPIGTFWLAGHWVRRTWCWRPAWRPYRQPATGSAGA